MEERQAMQQYPPEQPSQYPYSQPQPFQPGQPIQPPPPTKPKPPKWAMGCGYAVIALVVLGLCSGIYSLTLGRSSANSPTPTTAAQSQTTTAPTAHPTQASKPTPQAAYPPKTKADLMALAAKGDASAVHEFHSESVGLTGACPQPKREVTVDPSITGKQLAEDLLAYFYGNQLDNPCGSVVFAYHTQAEANGDGYTAGRVLFDTANQDGSANYDPNATNLKDTLTLDTGDVATGQEYVVNYTN